MASGEPANVEATLAAWRERGADRLDPTRFRFIEALARRAANHAGAARRVLNDRLEELLHAYGEAVANAQASAAEPDAAEDLVQVDAAGDLVHMRDARDTGKTSSTNDSGLPTQVRHPDADDFPVNAKTAAAHNQTAARPLAELLDYIAGRILPDSLDPAAHDDSAHTLRASTDAHRNMRTARDDSPAAQGVAAWRASYPELAVLDYFKEIWSRVSSDRQLQHSLEEVHENAGPLNSSRLVHQSLLLMRELSPGYLHQFLSYTDALSWMEQLNSGAMPAGKDAPRATAVKKSARTKA